MAYTKAGKAREGKGVERKERKEKGGGGGGGTRQWSTVFIYNRGVFFFFAFTSPPSPLFFASCVLGLSYSFFPIKKLLLYLYKKKEVNPEIEKKLSSLENFRPKSPSSCENLPSSTLYTYSGTSGREGKGGEGGRIHLFVYIHLKAAMKMEQKELLLFRT
ncbi:hypothetical protein F5X96DRAFT_664032 [Biscogniauxia mediterranea]|nr:hypothetical protein F5X96DRAFT_664032 [Biscogniauxia mediterranea]